MGAPGPSSPNSLRATASVIAPSRGRPRTLGREAVIETALRIVDQEGLGALTIRRLAADLGVGAATIANAAGSKEDILGGLVNAVLADVPEVTIEPRCWESTLIELFGAIHELLCAHPAVAQLAVVQPTTGPVILKTQEAILQLLRCGGLDEAGTVTGYTVLTSYLMGFTLFRISRAEPDPGARESKIERDMRQLPPDQLPQLHALAPALAKQTSTEQFFDGLRRLIRSLT